MNKKLLFISTILTIILFGITPTSLALNQQTYSHTSINCFNRFSWKWSTTEVISTESDQASTTATPSLTVESNGNIHVIWFDDTDIYSGGTDDDIVYKRWRADISAWSTTFLISTESSGMAQEPSLVIDSHGNRHHIWTDLTDDDSEGDSDIYYNIWNVTSLSLSSTETISSESDDASENAAIAIDSDDNLHVVWLDSTDYDSAGTDNDIFYKRRDASTESWTTTEVVSTESTDNSEEPHIAVDSIGNVHISWHDLTDYSSSGTDRDIFYKRWDALSTSWTTTEVLSSGSTDISGSASLAVDAEDNVHIAWYDWTDHYIGSGTDTDIFYIRWDSNSATWTPIELVSSESTGAAWPPTLTVDSFGVVHVVWYDATDYGGAGTDWDLFYSRKETGSKNWTITEVVSTESTSDSREASIGVDYAGTLHVAWRDSTDYMGFGSDYDIFYKKLSDVPLPPDLAFIVPNPDEDGSIDLDWNDVLGATTYHIYRSDSYVFSVEGLTPLDSTSNSYYVDTLPSTGFYYYAIVAENFVGNSTLSNCQYIEYKMPTLNEFVLAFGLLGGTAVVLIATTYFIKRKK